MVASWSISEEKYPQKNQGTAGLEPATFSFNCHLQARRTSALLQFLFHFIGNFSKKKKNTNAVLNCITCIFVWSIASNKGIIPQKMFFFFYFS
jgi:hypothetical protein